MNRIKNSPLIQFFYNLPGIQSSYHFLWAWVGAKFAGNPSRKITVIGVTGTKGKTTTLELLNAIFEAAGKKTALLSSLRAKVGEETQKNAMGNSMPGRGYLQRFLKKAVRANCEYAFIEVTSQGVVAHRHRFIKWDVGVITNLSPEHIEAHGSFENYRKAKLDFLKYVLAEGGKIFLNREDKHFAFFEEALRRGNPFSFSDKDESLREYFLKLNQSRSGSANVAPELLLSGFNAGNIAVAVAVAEAMGMTKEDIEKGLAEFRGVPGRLQVVGSAPYIAIVDYAHTPDSLEAVYKAVKPMPSAISERPRLICVLGAAGGGRDKWKRPAMGSVAANYCDEIILTNEDPYDEDPLSIIDEIEGGVLQARPQIEGLHKILDRKEAIKKAVAMMRPGDIVIGTGKGSEDWIHGPRGTKIAWNEAEIFKAALEEKEKAHR